MKKTLSYSLAALTLSGTVSTSALADDKGISREELNRLLQSASDYGFTHYDELGVDDGQFEIEGWRKDGWRLDVDMALNDGSLLREQQRQSQIPDWSLSGDEVSKALDRAQNEGLELIVGLDANQSHIEVDGYGTDHQEIEIRLNRNTFEVAGVEYDD
jgi:hypothetical protein